MDTKSDRARRHASELRAALNAYLRNPNGDNFMAMITGIAEYQGVAQEYEGEALLDFVSKCIGSLNDVTPERPSSKAMRTPKLTLIKGDHQ